MQLIPPLIYSFMLAIFSTTVLCDEKPIISDVALFKINQSIPLMARIDSGASRSSVNASNIQIKGASKKMRDNVGKYITFDIVDAREQKFPIETKILAIKTVKTPQGREHRYLVSLSLTWNGIENHLPVNLSDRSNLEYKLLIGRDWLSHNALVDVSPKPIIGSIAEYLIDDDFPITARIDTGATSTSINAVNMQVHDGAKRMTDNVGKIISFDIVNNKGDVKRLTIPIVQVIQVSNAMDHEYRYKVAIKIQWNDKIQMLNVNLKDRSNLTHKMLIGRDWLTNNAIVDSSL